MLRWTVHLKGAPNRGNNHSAVAVGNKIYYFGDPKRNTMKQIGVYIFNTVSLRWTKLRPVRKRHLEVPSVRRGHTVVLINDVIYIWGGHVHLTSTLTYCNMTYAFDVNTHKWFKPNVSGTVPEGRQHHSACALGNVMYVFGGETMLTRCTNDMYKLDTTTMVWSFIDTVASMKDAGDAAGCTPALVSSYHSATIIGTKMFVFGGWGGRGVDYNNIRVFETEIDCWLSTPFAQFLPEGRLAPRAFAYKGELYIFGGWNCNQTLSDLWKFNPETSWTKVEPKGNVPKKPWMCCCMVGDRIILFKDDLHILDLSPSLKTLCKLAVIQYRLDHSALPHNIMWELAAMRKTRLRRR